MLENFRLNVFCIIWSSRYARNEFLMSLNIRLEYSLVNTQSEREKLLEDLPSTGTCPYTVVTVARATSIVVVNPMAPFLLPSLIRLYSANEM